jgi:hypothetical protein
LPSISSITEWIGIFTLGVISATILPLIKGDSINITNVRKCLFNFVGLLSISAGIIHVLLVQEHMEEAVIWGLFFLGIGISQLTFGIIFMILIKVSLRNKAALLLYYIGIVGNTLLVAIFMLARLFVPPFSPEPTPVTELEANGIITVIIEILVISLLIYLVKSHSKFKQPIEKKYI